MAAEAFIYRGAASVNQVGAAVILSKRHPSRAPPPTPAALCAEAAAFPPARRESVFLASARSRPNQAANRRVQQGRTECWVQRA